MACKHVHISDCDIRAADDDFAIVGCEDVNISNCSLFSYSAAIRLGDTGYSTLSKFIDPCQSRASGLSRGEQHKARVFLNITLETTLITGQWWGKGEPIYIAARSGVRVRDYDLSWGELNTD